AVETRALEVENALAGLARAGEVAVRRAVAEQEHVRLTFESAQRGIEHLEGWADGRTPLRQVSVELDIQRLERRNAVHRLTAVLEREHLVASLARRARKGVWKHGRAEIDARLYILEHVGDGRYRCAITARAGAR